MLKRILFTLTLTFGSLATFSQLNLDSLWGVWNDPNQSDTNRLMAMNKICWDGYMYSQLDSALHFGQIYLDFAEQIDNKTHVASALNTLGVGYRHKGDYARAMDYQLKSLKIKESVGDTRGMANSLMNIAAIYKNQGDTVKAIDYNSQALQLFEQIENNLGISKILNNLGIIYAERGEYTRAMSCHLQSLKISEEIEAKGGIASSFTSIGKIHKIRGDSALAAGNQDLATENYEMAIDYQLRSIKLKVDLENQRGVAISFNNIGIVYKAQGNYVKARYYCSRSLSVAQEVGFAKEIKDAAHSLWEIAKLQGRHKEALSMHELYITTRDSILSEENQKAIISQQYKYEYEKQAAADSVKSAEQRLRQEASIESERRQNKLKEEKATQQQYMLLGGLSLALLFGVFIFNRFRVTRKQRDVIDDQKSKVDAAYHQLAEKNTEILDSINYAKRIQHSFLATEELLNRNLGEHFVYFNPKEAVSGDFYWAGELSNGNFGVSCADSTGHGVPGAIMSILNISSIERAVEKGNTKPAEIFNETRKLIVERLKNDGSSEGGRDGMDASLISFNADKTKMEYVAAHNPIWLIRNGELMDIKAEKMPVGKHDHDHIPFEGGELELQRGDIIYTLTDGFQDQFGGEKGKKFKVKPFKRLLLDICELSMEEQHQKVAKVFSDWKGKLEQVDDVCVIGIKV